jgi:hypothetical protein
VGLLVLQIGPLNGATGILKTLPTKRLQNAFKNFPKNREVFCTFFNNHSFKYKKNAMRSFITLLFSLICFVGFSQSNVVERDGRFYDENGNAFSGIYSLYHNNGKIKVKATISNGLPNGEMTFFYPSGKIKEKRVYTNGIKNGKWEKWNEQGVKTSEANFSNGQKHGKWYVWDDNGTLRYDMTYTNGKKSGTWIIFDENGKELSRKKY